MVKDINIRLLNNVDLFYDDVYINNGSGYYVIIGYFIVLEIGVYVFNWIMRERGDCFYLISLMVNGIGIGYFFLYFVFYEEDYFVMGVVVECINVGDYVYVFIIGILKFCNFGCSFIE